MDVLELVLKCFSFFKCIMIREGKEYDLSVLLDSIYVIFYGLLCVNNFYSGDNFQLNDSEIE